MLLNRTVIYTLRALTCLSLRRQREEDVLVSSKELSESTNIPQHYLSKIMRSLVKQDIVQASKGHHGGFSLLVEPSELYLASIFEAVDFQLEVDTCVFGWEACSSDKPCPLHNYWRGFRAEWGSWAELTTLQDMLDGNMGNRFQRLAERFMNVSDIK